MESMNSFQWILSKCNTTESLSVSAVHLFVQANIKDNIQERFNHKLKMNSYSLRFNRSKETHIYLLRSNQITYFSRKPLRKMNIMDLQNKSFAKTFSIHDHKMATSHLQPHNQQLITVTASDHQVEQTHHHTQLSARWIKTT